MTDALPDLFVRRGWRYFRHDGDSGYLVDAATGYLSAVEETLFTRASAEGVGDETALRNAATVWAARSSKDGPTTPWCEAELALLGGRILVRFEHERCRDDVLRHFSCSIAAPGPSPDVIVECDWERADRYLFRARPDELATIPLAGVRVQGRGDRSPRLWLSTQPLCAKPGGSPGIPRRSTYWPFSAAAKENRARSRSSRPVPRSGLSFATTATPPARGRGDGHHRSPCPQCVHGPAPLQQPCGPTPAPRPGSPPEHIFDLKREVTAG